MTNRELVDWIWKTLSARYGNKWTGQWPGKALKSAKDEWGRALGKFDPQSVLGVVGHWMGEWPPTLPDIVGQLRCGSPAHKAYVAPEAEKVRFTGNDKIAKLMRERTAIEEEIMRDMGGEAYVHERIPEMLEAMKKNLFHRARAEVNGTLDEWDWDEEAKKDAAFEATMRRANAYIDDMAKSK